MSGVQEPADVPVGIRKRMLLGEDHPALGAVELVEPFPGVALALSAGRYPKHVKSVDPNEDAVAAATDGVTTLLAVADGHNGFAAARAAIVAIHDGAGPLLATGDGDPRPVVRAALRAAVAAVTDPARPTHGRSQGSGTALTVAAAAGQTVAAGTYGDSAALVVGGARPRSIGKPRPFLTRDAGDRLPRVRQIRFDPDRTLVVMSDGAYGFLGPDWQRRVAASSYRLHAPATADAIVGAAFAGGAGDHVSVAVLHVPGP